MIPRKLTIEGVYSYKKRQIIDFTTLSEAGIFGVFGNVGSGKSAVLEAMTYALYGQIERLNDKEQRGYNIMNLQSSALYIDFEFSQESVDYRFAVTAKRHKKDFNKILSPERTGYRKEGEDWVPLPDEGVRGGITAESIIGLNYEHFRKTVIIPQGKFQEFIQLPPSQRTGMIETLFGLQRFNLSADCNFLLARSREECSFLEGRLDDLQELKKEDLEFLEQAARKREEELRTKDIQKKELSAQLTALSEYRKGKAALEETLQTLGKLELKKEGILKEEELLKQSRMLEELFNPLLLREKKSTDELTGLKEESRMLIKNSERVEEKLKGGEEYWQRLKKDQEDYSRLRSILDSLKALEELKEINKGAEQDNIQNSIISKDLTVLRSQIRKHKESRESSDSSIMNLEKIVEQGDDLSAVENWYRHQDVFAEKRQDLSSKISSLIKDEKKGYLELAEFFPSEDLNRFDSAESLEKHLLKRIQRREDELKQKEEQQKQKELDSTRLQLLNEMTEELEEGKPCPLCGSEHHPQAHGISTDNGISAEQEALNKDRPILLKQKEGILGIMPRLKYLEQERSKSEDLLSELKSSEKDHMDTFIWSFLKAGDRAKFDSLKIELNRHRSELKELRQKNSALEVEFRKLDNKIREKEGEQIRLETRSEHRGTQKKNLEELIIDQHKETTPDAEEYSSLRKRLEDLDRDYFRIKSVRESDENRLQDLKNRMQSNGHLIQKSSDELELLRNEIQKKLQDQGLSGREELNSFLRGTENLKTGQERIDNFHKNRNILLEQKKTLSASVRSMEKNPALKGAAQADPRHLQQELNRLDEELQSLLTGSGALGEQIEDLKAKLKQKDSLSSELDKQKIREENLKELSSLFKGGKFVQYIAAVYMQEMCQLANRRFSPITGRSLELVFQDNQIMVRDFLNEGRLRHIKTLSGGQSFQAALCLALALAEQTGRGKGSFFFLDEGFGSLDKASLETVMTTLRELSRKGRIIGLISHVEEMQQDLDVWIKIKRDPEEGSKVQCSWK
ncbi:MULTISPECIES: AAA family ATPase [unclassified Oceanispirochaeta]|uniref:AAA family ATPase n=1 Tax=unclassified Oceanispirochaeta TaxID=2635722 RepID=UPI000E095FE3|nr:MULTISPECIES: AAA family ATPase [unclassified Oceanispirochaeta]MBF9015296.1 AAA family ATPase [Oceanispirochaeta sp. M2]NPD71754.1 AAA family ATPase [Oceanispirochaeta sp. M1]RDG32946.1 hypothetical protein DV872_06555 [Oceanispirochaeta sp. M1]